MSILRLSVYRSWCCGGVSYITSVVVGAECVCMQLERVFAKRFIVWDIVMLDVVLVVVVPKVSLYIPPHTSVWLQHIHHPYTPLWSDSMRIVYNTILLPSPSPPHHLPLTTTMSPSTTHLRVSWARICYALTACLPCVAPHWAMVCVIAVIASGWCTPYTIV